MVNSCNFTAPIATLGALRNPQEVLLNPYCTQIFGSNSSPSRITSTESLLFIYVVTNDHFRIVDNPPGTRTSISSVSASAICSRSEQDPATNHAVRYQAALISTAFPCLRALTSRIGGWPKKRLYSRLNWLTLSYPTSKATVEASRPSTSIRPRAVCSRNCF